MSVETKPPQLGPCIRGADCHDATKSLGQWTYIPKKIALKYGKPEWSCVCKKAGCLRWAELPGAPPLKRAKLNEPAVAVALKEAEELPRPYALSEIHEIWGVRYCDITKMTEVERGNKLPFNPADGLVYAVHGKWQRTADDANGTHGCWYIRLKELMRTLKDDQEEDKHAFLRGKIEEFEKEHKEAREEAFETHANALEEGEDSDED